VPLKSPGTGLAVPLADTIIGRWGGGSSEGGDVNVESGVAATGVERRRSWYEINDNRLVGGEGERSSGAIVVAKD